ncbi:MAG: hypothetical protein IH840_03575 [Candidatus Heimdallarchaeota archaeon]|nr:hypothetical protein [Candidatus Heimdallarchaeota archaeon]
MQQLENAFAYSSYSGELTVTYKCKTAEQAKHKLRSLRRIRSIGRFQNSGMGAIEWTKGKLLPSPKKRKKWNRRKIKIRKGLPSNLPRAIQDLILYELLHDFYVTRLHPSKIYVEPDIQNQDLKTMLQRSHDPTDDILIKVNKRYDGLL